MIDENNADEPRVQAENNSIAIGGIRVGGNISGQMNIASGHIVHAERGATVIIGTPAEAVGGLIALRELMQCSTHVRMAMVAFQTDFRAVHEEVDRLGDYKDLHDLLHRLQFHCYNGIIQVAARFSFDEQTIDNLTDYGLTLEGIIEELKQVAARPSLPKQEVTWIEDIGLTKTDLHTAIDTFDEKFLKKVIWRLNRLLAIQPARINGLLNHAVRTLRLAALLSALARVCDYLNSLDLEPSRVNSFQSGVRALSDLDGALDLLVEKHDRWQALDVELRRIEASMDRDLFELEMSWPDVKLKTREIFSLHPGEWARALEQESDTLDEALLSNNPAKARRSFRSFQRRATNYFYQVDLELKALCGNLRQISMPLASVLEIIQ